MGSEAGRRLKWESVCKICCMFLGVLDIHRFQEMKLEWLCVKWWLERKIA
jgi:hypothetical protein